ncbi:MAG: Ppx/GppA family phosphatase [Verrucomicrobiota bacterium]
MEESKASPSFVTTQSSPSPPVRRAVIDIGTNSVKLLVATILDGEVTPIEECSKQTRLGKGFYESHLLQADAIAATAAAVQKFTALAEELRAENIRIIATSAARDANNASELLEVIERASGFKVEIISGEQEADWVFQGVTSDPRFAGRPLLILDVGGGSTEFILGENKLQCFRNSYRLGTVRLLEQLTLGDPPGTQALENCRAILRRFFEEEIVPKLSPALKKTTRPVQLVGTGGTTSILARMEKALPEFDRAAIESTCLSLAQITAHAERLWNLSLEERKKIIGLPAKRADVILTGLVIYEAVGRYFGFQELHISTRGLRFAAL